MPIRPGERVEGCGLTRCPDQRSAACCGVMITQRDSSAIGNICAGVPLDMSDMISDTGGIEDAFDVTTTASE
jgi:hypothetical protein